MSNKTTRKPTLLVASGIALAMTLAACGGGGGDDPTSEPGSTDTSTSEPDAGEAEAGCEAFETYGDLTGKTVSVYTSIVTPEDQPHIDSYKPFEDCTGATVTYEGSKEFEAQLLVKLESNNAPDIAYIPQPGLLSTIVEKYPDRVVEASAGTVENVDEYFTEAWKSYGTVDGKFYAAPLGANVKSFVWYSPSVFADNGYEVPTTWDDMIALSEKIVEDHGADGAKPWCAGIGSGDATGWPATDWLEDVVLRTAGPEVYDKWVTNEVKFDDPAIVEALGAMGDILRNPEFVNGGIGDVSSIATTEFQAGGLPILENELCFMHRQASFYAANWPSGTVVAEDGDVFAFYLPGKSDTERPLLGGGEFVAAFQDRPEVAAFQAYLASPDWANAKAKATEAGWVSANSGLDQDNLKSEIDQLSAKLLTDPSYEFRFDGSDMMPAAVGSGAFWTEMTAWIAEGKSDVDVLESIQGAWPSN